MKKSLKLKKNEQIAIESLKEALTKRFNISYLRLYGSKARGDSTAESDIDVMIEIDESSPEIESQIDDIIFNINLEYDTLISAIIMTRKEIEEGPMSEAPIYKVIQKEGIFSEEEGRSINKAFELRQRADYRENIEISYEQVEPFLEKARIFVQKVKEHLEKNVFNSSS